MTESNYPDVIDKAIEDTRDEQLVAKIEGVLNNPNTSIEEDAKAIRRLVNGEV